MTTELKPIYNIKTGEEVQGQFDLDGNQRHPNGQTFLKPPEVSENETFVFEGDEKKDGEWVIYPDHRGELYYSIETKQQIEIKQIGELSENLTDLEPGEFDKWDDAKWVFDPEQKKLNILGQLQSLDFKMQRSTEDLWLMQSEIPEYHQSIIDEKNALREEYNSL